MDLTLVYSPGFVREWNRLRLTDADLMALEEGIARSRTSAPVVQSAGGLRKLRFAPPSRHTGKSGAMRVGFAYFPSKSAAIVVTIFSKNEAANLSPKQRSEIAKWLKMIEKDFR